MLVKEFAYTARTLHRHPSFALAAILTISLGIGVVAHQRTTLLDSIRGELGAFGERIAITEMEPMSTLVTRAQAKTRFALVLIGLLASVAALLAAIGLYEVLSMLVRQRTAEIGSQDGARRGAGHLVACPPTGRAKRGGCVARGIAS